MIKHPVFLLACTLFVFANQDIIFDHNLFALGDRPPLTLSEKLQNKITELKNLNEKLLLKEKQLDKANDEYNKEVKRLKNEIIGDMENSQLELHEANQNIKISHNLILVQRQMGYMEKIEELKKHVVSAIEETAYLKKEAEADLKIANLLDDKDNLLNRIETAINKNVSYAGNSIIEKGNLPLVPMEKIWYQLEEEKARQKTLNQWLWGGAIFAALLLFGFFIMNSGKKPRK